MASPTRAPWIAANGWRIVRSPGAKFVYDVPSGKAALAAAEAFAYAADAVMKIDPADLESLGSLLTFLRALPPVDLPMVADFAVVDDGSPVTGEAMNLLARRNLLFEIVKAPSARHPLNIAIGSPGTRRRRPPTRAPSHRKSGSASATTTAACGSTAARSSSDG